MNQKIYLTFLTIITIICVLIGSAIHIFGFADRFVAHFLPGNDEIRTESDEKSSLSDQTKKEDTVKLDANIQKIKVDLGVASLRISHGDEASISYNMSKESLVPEITQKNGTLRLKQRGISNASSLFSDATVNISITVPFEVVKTLDISIGVGNVVIEDLSFNNVSIETGTGDTTIDSCSFHKLDIENGIGNVAVSGLEHLHDFDYDLECGIGDIQLDGETYGREYEHKADKDSQIGRIEVEIGTGDINIKE